MANRKSYHRNQSPLYRVTSPKVLAKRLHLSVAQLHGLLDVADNYIRWIDKDTGRSIQQPKPFLRAVHERVAKLLGRIETPDFLHSAVKGRSYISNALAHDPNNPTVKVDLKKFYQNARAQAVFHFFHDRMQCDGEVAGMLATLLTVDGHLPTGSSASPILSYFAYEDMFTLIEQAARQRGCVMTCYVDDMVFTGRGATPRLIHEVRRIAQPYRLWTHKTKVFGPGEPKVITGLAITTGGAKVPNHRRITIEQELRAFRSRPEAASINGVRTLVGQLYEAAQIDPLWQPAARGVAARLRVMQSIAATNDVPAT